MKSLIHSSEGNFTKTITASRGSPSQEIEKTYHHRTASLKGRGLMRDVLSAFSSRFFVCDKSFKLAAN
jgi:hypothetical protein